MRITDSIIFTNFLSQIQKLNRDEFKYNEQVTTGKKINRPSDDPVGASQLASLNFELSNLAQYMDNTDNALRQLGSTDERLNDVVTNMTRVIQLVEQGASENYQGQPRTGIAKEVETITQEMLGHADTQVGGRLIFAGTRTNRESLQQITGNPDGRVYSASTVNIVSNGTASFTGVVPDSRDYTERIHELRILDAAGNYELIDLESDNTVIASGTLAGPGDTISADGVTLTYTGGAFNAGDNYYILPQYSYNGTSDQIKMQVDENTYIQKNVSGSTAFGGTEPTGAVQNPGNTIFDDLVELRLALLTDDQATLINNVDLMRNEFDSITEVRANVGGRMSNLSTLDGRNQSEATNLVVQVADVENADLAEAITKLTQTTTGKQAALQAGARVGQLSLFNYIG